MEGAGAGGGQGDSGVTAAVLPGLLVLWPCSSFWGEAGKFGACKQRDVLSAGGWKLTRQSVLKRMKNKD